LAPIHQAIVGPVGSVDLAIVAVDPVYSTTKIHYTRHTYRKVYSHY